MRQRIRHDRGRRSAATALAIAAGLAATLTAVTMPEPAVATEAPAAAVVTSPSTATFTYRGGITATLTATQRPNQYGAPGFVLLSTTPHSAYQATSGMFAPALDPATTPTVGFQAAAGECGDLDYTGHCDGNGTVTIVFSQPVTDPILDISGLGGDGFCAIGVPVPTSSPCYPLYAAGLAAGTTMTPDTAGMLWFGSFMSQQLDIASATGPSGPVAVQFSSASPGATNLLVTPTRIAVDDMASDAFCDRSGPTSGSTTSGSQTRSFGVSAPAGCGSVTLLGTITSVTLDISTNIQQMPTANGWTNGYDFATANAAGTRLGDLARISIRLPEDLGDAPASYDGDQAAAHIQGPLHLGAGITADADDTTNPTVSPNAGTGADLDTDDAVGDGVHAPDATRGAAYTLTVPISGAAQPGEVAGWIDLNGDGTFDADERASADFGAGDTSVVLTWSIPATAIPGPSYARLRAAFTPAEVAAPNGIATSGEVEDYLLDIVDPVPGIAIVKGDADGNAADDAGTAAVLPDGTASLIYTITNTGDEPLTDLTVSDDVIANGTVTDLSCVFPDATIGTSWAGPLAADATFQCTAQLSGVAPGVIAHEDIGSVTGTGAVSGVGATATNPYFATTPVPPTGPGSDPTSEAPSTLAKTGPGYDPNGLAGIGGVLLLVGLGVLVAGRRRRQGGRR